MYTLLLQEVACFSVLAALGFWFHFHVICVFKCAVPVHQQNQSDNNVFNLFLSLNKCCIINDSVCS